MSTTKTAKQMKDELIEQGIHFESNISAQSLKKLYADVIEEVEDGPTQNTTAETVTIPKSVLDQLMADVKELKGESTPKTYLKKNEEKAHYVKIRFYKDKLVTKYGEANSEKDKNGREKFFLEVFTGEEMHKVPYLKFINGQLRETKVELAKVIEIKEDPIYDDHIGKVYKTEVEWKNYRTVQTNELVDSVVVIPNSTYVLERKNGEKVELHQSVLN